MQQWHTTLGHRSPPRRQARRLPARLRRHEHRPPAHRGPRGRWLDHPRLLVWAYAQGFPKSKSSLKPAWEPIVLARKPGPLGPLGSMIAGLATTKRDRSHFTASRVRAANPAQREPTMQATDARRTTRGRWPANVILTDPVFDGGWDGVVGGGMQSGGGNPASRGGLGYHGANGQDDTGLEPVDTRHLLPLFPHPEGSRS